MLIEDISTSQILTATLFIVALVAVQIYIIKNKNTLKGKWAPNKRIHLAESTRLGPTERVQIIKIDGAEFLYFFTKGNSPVVIQLNPIDTTLTKKINNSRGQQELPAKAKTPIGSDKSSQPDSKIIQAISLARKQNPKVSFE